MKNRYMALIEAGEIKVETPEFAVGDSVDVHQRILEGQKERVQVFSGTLIARKGAKGRETITVRRIVQGEGVERVFPVHSPKIAKIDVKRSGKTRRAKLYYLRDRVGKATKLREREAKAAPEASANGTPKPAKKAPVKA